MDEIGTLGITTVGTLDGVDLDIIAGVPDMVEDTSMVSSEALSSFSYIIDTVVDSSDFVVLLSLGETVVGCAVPTEVEVVLSIDV